MTQQTTLPLTGEDDTLSQVQALGRQLEVITADIEDTEDRVKALKDMKKNIEEVMLPDLLAAAGLSEFKLMNGTKISLNTFYDAKLVNREACFTWLRETGNDGVIKNTIKTEFGKGEEAKAVELEYLLEEKNLPYQRKADVHHMTLKSLVRDCVENDIDIPKEDFGVYVGNRVTIKK